MLIGQPIERLIHKAKIGKLNIRLGRNFELSVPITHSLNTKVEPFLELDPIEEVKFASLDDLIELNLENAQFFIEEGDEDSSDPKPLDKLMESPKPLIELELLLSGLRYVFLNNDP